MPDLFISYSSHDRPWAERLYNDLRRRSPDLQIFWDRDPESLPPDVDWPAELEDKARHTTHFVILWSEHAKASNQVGPEIQAFDQNRQMKPVQDDAKRKLFYIPLEGEYGPLEVKQGFTELRRLKIYSPTEEARGVDKLKSGGAPEIEWKRLVRIIGDTVGKAEQSQEVNLAVLAMNEKNFHLIGPLVDEKIGAEPTLRELLNAVGLALPDIEKRYSENALFWQPYGDGRTVIDLMEDLRDATNAPLSPEYRFHWKPCDLVEIMYNASHIGAFEQSLEQLAEPPSAVVVDLISLFHPVIYLAFARLIEYVKREHSMIITLAPNQTPAADLLYQSLRSKGAPVLNGYFLPQIPSTGTFARCSVNVPYVMEVERLVRSSLGTYYLERKKVQERPLVASGA